MHGVGYDSLDVDAIQAAGISASNNPGFNASTVAEHTVMLMLVLLHRFVEAHDTTRSGAFPTAAFIGANQRLFRELDEENCRADRLRQHRPGRRPASWGGSTRASCTTHAAARRLRWRSGSAYATRLTMNCLLALASSACTCRPARRHAT
jgi:D-isomer specific 2-hydroxyacid dehydrogenase-like protein